MASFWARVVVVERPTEANREQAAVKRDTLMVLMFLLSILNLIIMKLK